MTIEVDTTSTDITDTDACFKFWKNSKRGSNYDLGGVLVLASTLNVGKTIPTWVLYVYRLIGLLYSSIHLVVPKEFLNSHKKLQLDEVILEPALSMIIRNITIHCVENYDSKSLIEIVNKIPLGAAVAVINLKKYRFEEKLESQSEYLVTPDGKSLSLLSPASLAQVHFEKLLEKMIKISEKNNLFITAFFNSHYDLSKIPKYLKNNKNWGIATLGSEESNDIVQEVHPILKKVGIDKTFEYIDSLKMSNLETVKFKATAFFIDGKFNNAWKMISPVLHEFKSNNSSLGFAQIADAVGEQEKAIELVLGALNRSLNLEELVIAERIASKYHDKNCLNIIHDLLVNHYPNARYTIFCMMLFKMKHRVFDEAIQWADKYSSSLGDHFYSMLCHTLKNKLEKVEEFVDYAKRFDHYDEALLYTGREAFNLKNYESALTILIRLDNDSLEMRDSFFIISKCVENIYLNSKDISKIEPFLYKLLKYIADHPNDTVSRAKYERLSLDIFAEVHLVAFNISNVFNKLKSFKPSLVIDDFKPQKADHNQFDDLMQLLSSQKNSEMLVGYGGFHSSINHLTKQDYIPLIYDMFMNAPDNTMDIITSNMFLHFMILLCKKYEDVNYDVYLARIIIIRLALEGKFQDSRNIAEHVLLSVPKSRKTHIYYRTGLAWLSYSEAFHRSHNYQKSLLYICFAINCFEKEASWRAIMETCDLMYKILRDLDLHELAMEALNYTSYYASTHNIDINKQIIKFHMLSISMHKALHDRDNNELYKIFLQAESMLNNEDEVAPLMLLQANIYKQLKLSGFNPPDSVFIKFPDKFISKFGKNNLSSYILRSPSIDSLKEALQCVVGAINSSDLVSQMSFIEPHVKSAIRKSFETNNIELYLLAAGILGIHAYIKELNSESHKSNDMQNVMFENLDSFDLNSTSEIVKQNNKVNETDKVLLMREVTSIANVDLQSIRKDLNLDTVILLNLDDRSHIIQATITKDALDIIDHGKKWYDNFCSWKRSGYPYNFSNWTPYRVGDQFSDSPSTTEVATLMEGMCLNTNLEISEAVSIIPCPQLFGLPFAMSCYKNNFLGQDQQVSTYPSLNCFIEFRENIPTDNEEKVAWFGGNTDDTTILSMKSKMDELLSRYSVSTQSTTIPHAAHAKLAIACAHGGLIGDACFKTITGETVLSDSEFANHYESNSCVILLICSSGRGDHSIFSGTVQSLITRLMNNGNKCVIAPIFPLDISIGAIWMETFLKGALENGKSINESAKEAISRVKQTYDNPCAWGNIHVYGNGNLNL